MNRGAVAAIAIAVMLIAIFIAMTDPSRNGQQLALAVGFFASIVILIGIISLAGEGGSTQGDTSQTVNFYMPPQQAAPPPTPPAAPQIVYIPMPQAPQPHYLPPGYAQPYLPPPPQPGYLPAPQQAQYRGALDVVAEPAPYALGYHPQHQVQRGAVAQLESPKASLARRLARRLVG